MSSENLHEAREDLPEDVIDKHRAITSLIEEFDAVDWYDQRAAVTQDAELKAILIHNRNEEMEHAAMVLEWLRRRYPVIDEHLRTYLYCEGDILEAEEEATGKADGDEAPAAGATQPAAASAGDGSLGIGSLRDA
ncbi:MAG: ferritin [Gammaproteobacteria bacterium]|nr:MAG: ferritin [Gammaproteobacteria bacterium]